MLSLATLFENVAEDVKFGKMVAFYVPKEIAHKLYKIGNRFQGDAVKPDDMHITVGLVRSENSSLTKKALEAVAFEFKPFSFDIDKISYFPGNPENSNMEVLHAVPSSSDFFKIHEIVFDVFSKFNIDIDNGSFAFKPHITIKYCKPNQNLKKKIDSLKISQSGLIDNISFADNKKIHSYKFGGGTKK